MFGGKSPLNLFSWVENVSYRFSRQRFELGVCCSQLCVLQFASQGLDGGERRVDLHGATSFMSLEGNIQPSNAAPGIMCYCTSRYSNILKCVICKCKCFNLLKVPVEILLAGLNCVVLAGFSLLYLLYRCPELSQAGGQVFGTLTQLHGRGLIGHCGNR